MGAARAGLSGRLEALGRRVESRVAARLPPDARARMASRVRAQPTREGAWFLVLLLGVVLAALNTGNNLLYMVLGCLLAALVLNNVLAEWNLRGLSVGRVLPDEAWAERAAGGAFVVRNARRFGAGWALRVSDHLAGATAPVAEARVLRVAPGEVVEAPARWVFPDRGEARLVSVVVESTFPFGLVRRWRELEATAEVLVFPRPEPGLAKRRVSGRGLGRPDRARAGRGGDFRGLREYVPGDPLRDLHWPTSARAGRPMVIVRNQEVADEVVVDVIEARGPAWERSLSRAAGQILHHAACGHAVGLRLEGRAHEPRVGAPWKRHLLGLLARAPRRDGG